MSGVVLAPNSAAALSERVDRGLISWRLVLFVSFTRTILSFALQALVGFGLHLQGQQDPFVAAGRWFTVYGTVIDLGTLGVLTYALRREGIGLSDLFRSGARGSFGRSLLWVLPVLVALGVAGAGTAAITGLLVHGTAASQPPVSSLPLWAGLYSALVWPVIWAVTEQATYDGYAAPRLAALGRTRWAAAFACLGWAAQHLALPFRPDLAFLAYRFVPSLAVAVVCVAFYLRTRNLVPLVISHWIIDAGTGALTLLPPAA